MTEVARLTGGDKRLAPGTLYTTIKRLLADGWIEESGERLGSDARRQSATVLPTHGLGSGCGRHGDPPARGLVDVGPEPVPGRSGVTRQERVYRQLLHLYPASFRRRYETEMVTLFRDQLRDERTAGRSAGGAGVWVHTLVDIAKTAPAEHFRRELFVPKPVDPAPIQMVDMTGRSPRSMVVYCPDEPAVHLDRRPRWSRRQASWTHSSRTRLRSPVSRLGVVILFVDPRVGGVGDIVVARSARSRLKDHRLRLVVFTLPAMVAIIVGPALILIIQNLAS